MSTIRPRRIVDRCWAVILDRSFADVPRPTDAPFAYSTGSDPYRVLIFGSGTAVGWGLRSHDLALPGQLARELGERTSHGVDVDLIADRCMTALSAVPALEGRLIAPYDAVVVSLGMTDSLRLLSAHAFRARMRAVLAELSARTSPDTRLVVLGMQPVPTIPFVEGGGVKVLERHAVRLDRVLRELSEEFAKASYVGMSAAADPDAGRTASHYRRWAEDLAVHLAPMLLDSEGAGMSHLPFDEATRVQAVRELDAIPAASDGRLDRIVELARTAFSADIAAVTLMEGDRQRMIAVAGMEPVDMPRHHSISHYALGTRTGLVVGNTTADRRFKRTYATSIGLRFYAGFPLFSAGGQPVGTLSVLSAEPRPAESVDLELLRDIAGTVQREMWTASPLSA